MQMAVDKDGPCPCDSEAPIFHEYYQIHIQRLFALPSGQAFWEELKTYQNYEGAIVDILTVSRLNSSGHFFIARL